MLSNLGTESMKAECVMQEALHTRVESRYSRSEEEDMQQAIAYLYEFKKKLDKLHPNCVRIVEHMLQRPTNGHY